MLPAVVIVDGLCVLIDDRGEEAARGSAAAGVPTGVCPLVLPTGPLQDPEPNRLCSDAYLSPS